MNGVLNSEAKFQSCTFTYTEQNGHKIKENFSDLVPFSVTVESVLSHGRYSFIQLNPMTASNYSDNAVIIHSIVESHVEKTGLNMLGTVWCRTSTVTFLNYFSS